MYRQLLFILVIVFLSSTSVQANAQMSRFESGPVFTDFGKHAPVDGVKFDKNTKLKVAFDVDVAAEGGELNRRFDSLARFINMHTAAGVNPDNIELALVVHGKGAIDLLDNPSYQEVYQKDNPNKALLQALMENNVKVILCGQTAAARQITEPQLVKGAKVELSAMTAHAILQQQGYTMNPF